MQAPAPISAEPLLLHQPPSVRQSWVKFFLMASDAPLVDEEGLPLTLRWSAFDWEYRTQWVPREETNPDFRLNEGWELTGQVDNYPTGANYFLKRRKW